MNCDLIKNELIYMYIDGFLTDEEKAALELHFEECPDCQAAFLQAKQMMKSLSLFGADEAALPEGLHDEIVSAIKKEKMDKQKFFRKQIMRFSTAAAVFAFLFIAGGYNLLADLMSGGGSDAAVPQSVMEAKTGESAALDESARMFSLADSGAGLQSDLAPGDIDKNSPDGAYPEGGADTDGGALEGGEVLGITPYNGGESDTTQPITPPGLMMANLSFTLTVTLPEYDRPAFLLIFFDESPPLDEAISLDADALDKIVLYCDEHLIPYTIEDNPEGGSELIFK